MGLLRFCGIYVNLEGVSSKFTNLCWCCRKPSPPQQPKNDPAAFLVKAAAAKAAVKRIPSYSKMISDDSFDSKSDLTCPDSKGIPGKKSWRRQAKKWTKRTKKKATLENKSSSEGQTKLERCIRKKTRRFRSGSDKHSSRNVSNEHLDIDEEGSCSSSKTNNSSFYKHKALSRYNSIENVNYGKSDSTRLQIPQAQARYDSSRNASSEHLELDELSYNAKDQGSKFQNSAFHQKLAESEKKKPMAEVQPRQKQQLCKQYSLSPETPPPTTPSNLKIASECLDKWKFAVKHRDKDVSRSPSPSPRRLQPGIKRQKNVSSVKSTSMNIDDSTDEEDYSHTQVDYGNYQTDEHNSNNDSTSSSESNESTDSDKKQSSDQITKVGLSSINNPAYEGYGGVVVCLHEVDPKVISIGIIEIRGIPWVGGITGLMLEVGIPPKMQWLALPPEQGPKVKVNLKVTVKIPRKARETQKPSSLRRMSKKWSSSDDSLYESDLPLNMVRVSVWMCGRIWRYGAIGHALVPLRISSDLNPKPVVIGLHKQLEPSGELGALEVGLEFQEEKEENVINLFVRILRARNLVAPSPSFKSLSLSRKYESQDIWCSIGLWTEGEKVQKATTPKVVFPVTCDPVFRSSSKFSIPKDALQNTCVVIKVITGRSLLEEKIGKIVLGPLLYLGTTVTQTAHPPPVALSHWGKALNHTNQVDMWHKIHA